MLQFSRLGNRYVSEWRSILHYWRPVLGHRDDISSDDPRSIHCIYLPLFSRILAFGFSGPSNTWKCLIDGYVHLDAAMVMMAFKIFIRVARSPVALLV
jgi:hypothetical protein